MLLNVAPSRVIRKQIYSLLCITEVTVEESRGIYILKENETLSIRRILFWDFPGGPVVKNLHCNSGGVGSIPGQGTKVPHTEKQLSSHNATTEPTQCN